LPFEKAAPENFVIFTQICEQFFKVTQPEGDLFAALYPLEKRLRPSHIPTGYSHPPTAFE
jgi:hypothetical protein